MYNELAVGKSTDILDDTEYFANRRPTQKAFDAYVQKIIRYIDKTLLQFCKTLEERYFILSDFLDGAKDHGHGLPYIPLHESTHSIAFMPRDIPKTQNAHILVIPKKQYRASHDVPKAQLADLMQTVQRMGKSLVQTHAGYNVLLNNGFAAGQYIHHVHFHVVPRDRGDNIAIEKWIHAVPSPKRFKELNKLLKKHIRKTLKE